MPRPASPSLFFVILSLIRQFTLCAVLAMSALQLALLLVPSANPEHLAAATIVAAPRWIR